MQLLVSVRSPAEVEPALAGGADILDAKEPSHGSLGAVAPDTLAQILECVPADRPFSVALGDVVDQCEVVAAITSLHLPRRPSPVFLKLGFAGVRSPEAVGGLIQCAKATVAKHSTARVVAVAYADADLAGTLAPETILRIAYRAGAVGVLLDTHTKDGKGLLGWLTLSRVSDLVAMSLEWGLLTAVAGELRLADVESVSRAGPDVMGVRGAACDGGREGRVTADRVRALRQRMVPGHSASVPGPMLAGNSLSSRNA
jgi:(5-formylfuran-3-yl)methyl phosphate synthase